MTIIMKHPPSYVYEWDMNLIEVGWHTNHKANKYTGKREACSLKLNKIGLI